MEIGSFGAVLLASCVACAITTIGIFVIVSYAQWGKDNAVYFMSFASGVLISVTFMHIIPTSLSLNQAGSYTLLAGFFVFYLFNRFVSSYMCHECSRIDYSIGLVPVLGIGFHSFLDGVIFTVTFNVSIFTGVLAAIGMVLHEFPEGIVTFLLLERIGLGKKKSAWYAFLTAAISTPLGALLSYPWIEKTDRSFLGLLLAFSAGALVYVGASHLLPAVERESKKYSLISMIAGVCVALVVMVSK